MQEAEDDQAVQVYPNPSNGAFEVLLPGCAQDKGILTEGRVAHGTDSLPAKLRSGKPRNGLAETVTGYLPGAGAWW
jgi:hypothetical protein